MLTTDEQLKLTSLCQEYVELEREQIQIHRRENVIKERLKAIENEVWALTASKDGYPSEGCIPGDPVSFVVLTDCDNITIKVLPNFQVQSA